MTKWISLFAQKLRAHRVGSGAHGRMTQEQLAEVLGVSVDAISKYERSLSYIRGDLEHHLAEGLGWSNADIVACREDWEARRSNRSAETYRLLTQSQIMEEFEGSAKSVTQAVARMEVGGESNLPNGFSASHTIWSEIFDGGFLTGVYVMHGAEMVGHVGLLFPGPVLEASFRDYMFDEGELSPDLLKRPILPGDYFGYCPAIYIARGHEAAGRPLLTGFVQVLEGLAEREILLREIGAISVNVLGRQLCEDLGLRFQGMHRRFSEFGLWVLPGQEIASSILGRRSPKLRQVYMSERAW